jgi:two-component system KDP operon response regulator KdpE
VPEFPGSHLHQVSSRERRGKQGEIALTAVIQVIDSDAATISEVQWALSQDGYQVCIAQPGLDAVQMMLIKEPDLVILGFDSQEQDWRFLRHLLTFNLQPLLLLFSTGDVMEQVRGLELGADDFMTKPIVAVELVARTQALLRRSMLSGPRRRKLFVDGDLVIDLTRWEVHIDAHPIALTPTEFRILTCLINRVGEVLSHKWILTQVWGPHHMGESSILKPHIHNLRKKLEPDPRHPRRIITRRGTGYQFNRLLTESC